MSAFLKGLKDGDTIDVYVIGRDSMPKKVEVRVRDGRKWVNPRLCLDTTVKPLKTYYVECYEPTAWLTFEEARQESVRILESIVAQIRLKLYAAENRLGAIHELGAIHKANNS